MGTPRTVSLSGEKIIKEIPARVMKTDKVVIESIIDYCSEKKVIANTIGYTGVIVLWEGDAYDAIGQWTDADVDARIREIYK